MKVMFVEAKKKTTIEVDKIDFSKLPEQVFVVYSIQFEELAERIKEKLGERVVGFQQVLGCSFVKSEFPILLIGSGRFHAINLALKGNTVYLLENKVVGKLEDKEVERVRGKRKAAVSKFYAAEKLGILVSTKPGQENLASALNLKKKLEKTKEVCLFLADNIDLGELENYPVDSWVNTSCQALTFDSRVANLMDLEN